MRTLAGAVALAIAACVLAAIFPAAKAGPSSIEIIDNQKNYAPGNALNGTAIVKFNTLPAENAQLTASIDGSATASLAVGPYLSRITYHYKSFPFSYVITASGNSQWYEYSEKQFYYRLQASGTCGNQACAQTGTCDCGYLCTPPASFPYSCTWTIPYSDLQGTVKADDDLKLIFDASDVIFPPTSANDDTVWSQLVDTQAQYGVQTTMRMACGNSDYMGQPTQPNGWIKRTLQNANFVPVPGSTKKKISIGPFDESSLSTNRQKFVEGGCSQPYACGGIYAGTTRLTSGFSVNGTMGEVTINVFSPATTYIIVYLPPNGPSLCAYTTSKVLNSTAWTAASLPQQGTVSYDKPFSKAFTQVQLPSVFNDSNRGFINPPPCPGYVTECNQTATSYSTNKVNDTTGVIQIGFDSKARTVNATLPSPEITGGSLSISLSDFRDLKAPSYAGEHTLSISLQAGPESASKEIAFSVCMDADKDGFCSIESGGSDCNDSNSNMNPGARELCNGIDDDCDGLADEDFMTAGRKLGTACNISICTGKWVCSWDRKDVMCNISASPKPEVCGNGIDDDCNGITDDPYKVDSSGKLVLDSSGKPIRICGIECEDGDKQECRALGECGKTPGQRTCTKGVWGTCKGGAQPSEEVCNGKDDDCNGIIDDIAGSTEPVESGCACANQPANKIPQIMAGREICGNGMDDNCDGQVDEGCACIPGETRPCGLNKGICKKGVQSCKNGQWESECRGGKRPEPEEICYNNLDDNCNGKVDDGCTPSITCQNGKQDLNEEGVDCGGPCQPCGLPYNWILVAGGVILLIVAVAMLELKGKL
jgi:hypothetical protein